MTTEPTGPANTDEDPLGPSAPQPEPTGDPRRPGSSPDSASNIRDAQGTSPGGTVPAGHTGGRGTGPEDALDEPESADG